MFDQLLYLIQKPALWQRSIEPFWDDEHILKGMIEAHLNPEWDAASRKYSTINEYLVWDTAYTVQRLTDEVSPFGFKVSDVFDDVCGSPYTSEAETLCFVLERGVE